MELAHRIPEPELMDEPEQAAAYSEADFRESHQRFADEVGARFDDLRTGAGTMVDVGCGPADVTVRIARMCPQWSILAIDGAGEMLRLGEQRVRAERLDDRISFEQVLLPSPRLLERRFDGLVSNSLLHHLADPAVLWDIIRDCVPAGAPVAVMDLRRPPTTEAADRLVEQHAADAPPVLRADFANSLRAAYTADEVRAQLERARLTQLTVEELTDRHLLIAGRR